MNLFMIVPSYRVAGCVIRNTGAWAVRIGRSKQSGVLGCDITETGLGGVSLEGGDRKTLTPAGLYAENNHIYHYSRWSRMYQAGIACQGVGNRIAHNLIHDAPHEAIGYGGNDHVIEFNEIHSVCYDTNAWLLTVSLPRPTTIRCTWRC